MASSVPDVTVLEELSDNFLQCPIHLDRYEKPKMLPCLHSVCLSCLKLWQKQAGATDQVTCPQCRKVCPVPSDGIQGLPDNFLINSLLDYVDQQASDGENRMCDICDTNSPSSEVMRCVDCSMFLCNACTASHKKIPLTADHQLISMAEFTGMSVAEKLNLTSPMCPKHPTSRLEFFCTKCKMPICTQCTVVAHKAPVHKIQELTEAFTKLKKQLENELKGAHKKHAKIQQAIADTTANMSELESQRDLAYETAQQQAERIIDLVSQYQAEIEEQIEQEFADQKATMDKRLEDLLQIDEDFKHTEEFGDRVMQFGNQVTLTSVGPDIMRKINDMKSACQEMGKGKVKAELIFKTNDDFVDAQLCCDSIGYVEQPGESSTEKEDSQSIPSTPTSTELDVAFLPSGTPSAEHTVIKRTYKGRTYPGKTLNLLLLVRDCLGNPAEIEDTSVFHCQVKMSKMDEETKAALDLFGQLAGNISVGKNPDGDVMLSFIPSVPGVFTLLVTMSGKPVRSYPYSVQVFPHRINEEPIPSLLGDFGEMHIEEDDNNSETGSEKGGTGRRGRGRGGYRGSYRGGGGRGGGRGSKRGGGAGSGRGGSVGSGGVGSGHDGRGRGGSTCGGRGGVGSGHDGRGRGGSAGGGRGGVGSGHDGRGRVVARVVDVAASEVVRMVEEEEGAKTEIGEEREMNVSDDLLEMLL
ncbi:E3 ubiquitin-protein ligase TRIM45-like [Amphiura filiformis]|uniref:E3 ubiquitin-protein ligase TRIM45-like n=1 Tax=Amphiura filiformis TaxID=82378 RepID=UPI003B21D0F0